jgi:UPF0716 protein FxsA
MPLIVFVLLVLIPAVEIASIILMTSWVGGAATFALILIGAVLGFIVMRQAGRSWWAGLRTAAGGVDERGVSSPARAPDGALAADRGLLFLAGLLIAIPGFVGDVLGLLLLVPPVRSLLRVAAAAWFVRRFVAVTGPGGSVLWRSSRGGAATVHVDRVVPGEVVEGDRQSKPRGGQQPGDQQPGVIRGEILPGSEEPEPGA